jgi:Flp pilus assembly protein TadG
MLKDTIKRATKFAIRFARAHKGVAAVEFALIAPVMCTLYFGMVEASDAETANSKMTSVASTAADLVSQDSNITNADMTNIMNCLTTLMSPYSTTNLTVVISSLVDSGNGHVTVAWSDAHGTTARSVGSTVTIPTGLVTSGSGGSVIMSEVHYNYSSPAGEAIYGSISMSDVFYSHPRQGATVTRSTS